MVIKWTNRISRETGYVKQVDTKNKCFENTFDRTEAKVYGNRGAAASAIRTLNLYGEGVNNEFAIEG